METEKLQGGCHCGNIQIELTLTTPAAACNPRACDCDFCRKHNASYISDSQGALRLHVKDEYDLAKYKQGNKLADL